MHVLIIMLLLLRSTLDWLVQVQGTQLAWETSLLFTKRDRVEISGLLHPTLMRLTVRLSLTNYFVAPQEAIPSLPHLLLLVSDLNMCQVEFCH